MSTNRLPDVRRSTLALAFLLVVTLITAGCALLPGDVDTGESELSGVVDLIGPDALVFDGTVVRINAETTFRDEVEAGDRVRVVVRQEDGGELIAVEVSVLEEADNANDDDDNENRANVNANRNDNTGNANAN